MSSQAIFNLQLDPPAFLIPVSEECKRPSRLRGLKDDPDWNDDDFRGDATSTCADLPAKYCEASAFTQEYADAFRLACPLKCQPIMCAEDVEARRRVILVMRTELLTTKQFADPGF